MYEVQQVRSALFHIQFWRCYDTGLAFLLLLSISDAFVELGFLSRQWLVCYVLLLFRILPVFPHVLNGIVQNPTLFIFPMVCLSSTLWSDAPKISLIFSIQYLVTLMFGLWLGLRFDLREIMLFLFWLSSALIGLSAVHYMTGFLPVAGFDNEGRVIGVFAHKSYLARQALICTLSATALFLSSKKLIARFTIMVAVLALPLSIALMVLSESVTYILTLPFALGFFAFLSRHALPAQFVFWSASACVALVALFPAGLAYLGIDPLDLVFDATGKDRTLTGRTVLWDVALEQIMKNPIFGVGFGAFWEAPQYAAQRFQILRAGATSPSLHNFLLEIWVATGIVGLCAALIFISTAIMRCYRLWRLVRTVQSAFALTLCVLLVMLSLNTPGLSGQHEIQFVLLMAFAVSALRGIGAHRSLAISRVERSD